MKKLCIPFYFNVSKSDCQKYLKSPSQCLLRDSNSCEGSFALSFTKEDNTIQHFLIRYENGIYKDQRSETEYLEEIIYGYISEFYFYPILREPEEKLKQFFNELETPIIISRAKTSILSEVQYSIEKNLAWIKKENNQIFFYYQHDTTKKAPKIKKRAIFGARVYKEKLFMGFDFTFSFKAIDQPQRSYWIAHSEEHFYKVMTCLYTASIFKNGISVEVKHHSFKRNDFLTDVCITREIAPLGLKGLWHSLNVDLEIIPSGSLQEFSSLFQILRSSSHRSILHIFGIFHSNLVYYLVLQLAEENLTSYMLKNSLTPQKKISLLKDLCSGMDHLHSQSLQHNNLTPSTILISNDGSLKISGLVTISEEGKQPNPFISFNIYQAPEVYQIKQCSFGADIWSFGIILYEILTGRNPFSEIPSNSVRDEIVSISRTLNLPKFENLQPILSLCLKPKPSLRGSFSSHLILLSRLSPKNSVNEYDSTSISGNEDTTSEHTYDTPRSRTSIISNSSSSLTPEPPYSELGLFKGRGFPILEASTKLRNNSEKEKIALEKKIKELKEREKKERREKEKREKKEKKEREKEEKKRKKEKKGKGLELISQSGNSEKRKENPKNLFISFTISKTPKKKSENSSNPQNSSNLQNSLNSQKSSTPQNSLNPQNSSNPQNLLQPQINYSDHNSFLSVGSQRQDLGSIPKTLSSLNSSYQNIQTPQNKNISNSTGISNLKFPFRTSSFEGKFSPLSHDYNNIYAPSKVGQSLPTKRIGNPQMNVFRTNSGDLIPYLEVPFSEIDSENSSQLNSARSVNSHNNGNNNTSKPLILSNSQSSTINFNLSSQKIETVSESVKISSHSRDEIESSLRSLGIVCHTFRRSRQANHIALTTYRPVKSGVFSHYLISCTPNCYQFEKYDDQRVYKTLQELSDTSPILRNSKYVCC